VGIDMLNLLVHLLHDGRELFVQRSRNPLIASREHIKLLFREAFDMDHLVVRPFHGVNQLVKFQVERFGLAVL